MKVLQASITLPLNQAHSADNAKGVIEMTTTTNRVVKDNSFAGQGERVTNVPSIRNIYLVDAPSAITNLATLSVNGTVSEPSNVVTIAKVSQTQIKGVK